MLMSAYQHARNGSANMLMFKKLVGISQVFRGLFTWPRGNLPPPVNAVILIMAGGVRNSRHHVSERGKHEGADHAGV